MKKVFLILAAALMAAPSVNAQDDIGVRFGIKLAPNLSWLRSDTKGLESDGSKLGYTFGLNLEFPIGSSGNYRFATGAMLNTAGGKYLQTFSYTDANSAVLTKDLTYSMTLRYIEVPWTLKLMTNEIGYMRYFGQVGLGTAANIRAKADYDTPVYDANGAFAGFAKVTDEDLKKDINIFKASLIVGAGFEYNFSGNTAIMCGFTYNNGFTNALKDIKVGDKTAKVFQDYVELNLGVFF